MKKMFVMLVIGIIAGLFGCKKSTPAEPKAAEPAVKQTQPAAEKAAPAVQQTADDAQKSAEETAQKAAESAQPAAEQVKEALTTAAAEIDLTSPIETLKEQAKKMSIDALKATAEKYKAKFLSTKADLATKTDQQAKILATGKSGADVLALAKDIQTLTNTLDSLKERMMVYVDILKAQGVDISSFTL
jgi:flagellum-specific peptidoglycan hydrolase FlgJ